ncbi:periplasmic heavy metal sensor [Asticcacaulis sp. AND118]|uniref:periplasmic heavy metal sensor n=1 Tax=Asticcacaulis sp. AND118 TaxID=2840468 RepID=UPI001CFFC71A|nr:periplasmic heavy metal sensor [Asticcacaulis sp. AND118]UDF04991.1 periplasmic heavy metal sensor [Asticcacaulis sp. AND118]
MKRYKTLILSLSLGLNVFLIACGATLWIRHKMPPPFATPEQIEQAVLAPLQGQDRLAMERAFASRKTQIEDARQNYRRSLRRAITIVAQPDLDVPALRREAATAKAARSEMTGLMVDAMLEGVEHMSPQGRRGLLSAAPARQTSPRTGDNAGNPN